MANQFLRETAREQSNAWSRWPVAHNAPRLHMPAMHAHATQMPDTQQGNRIGAAFDMLSGPFVTL